jgi:hypothetical protein
MPSALGKTLEQALNNFELTQHIALPLKTPAEPSDFYRDFGYLRHPRTGKPVTQLAPYQLETWKGLHEYKRILEVKSNKVGETTKWLLADFHLAVLPTSHPFSTRGYDTLVIAQTIQHAKEHLTTLRKMILNSRKYRPFLISKPDEVTLRDEVTKISTIYIRNTDAAAQPSRIIGLGLSNAGSILSWKNVKHIHISDPTATEGDYSEGLNGAMTRLANTDGTMVIETVPSGPQGKIYEMYQQYSNKEWKKGDFKVYTVTADDAVSAGIIPQEFLDAEKVRLGILYPQYYEAKFVAGSGFIFPAELVDKCVQEYDLTLRGGRKVLAVDPAYSEKGSKFGIVGLEQIDGIQYVKEALQFSAASPSGMLDLVAQKAKEYDNTVLCDSAHPGLIRDLREEHHLNAQPVKFNEKLSEMTSKSSRVIKEQRIRIHPIYKELISQLKTITYNEKGHPDKKRQTFDIGDALMMSVSHFGTGELKFIYLGSIYD